MHYKIEVIIPPTDDIEAAVAQTLAAFDENGKDEDGIENRHGFWDWYVIGGRWAGDKQKARLCQESLQSFYDWMTEQKVTVSSFQAGKHELKPAEQIPLVDAAWKRFFPEWEGEHCPLFSHSNNQYSDSLSGDVCKVSELTGNETASKVVIAKRHWRDGGKVEAAAAYQDSVWNGVNHEDTAFDGNVKSCLEGYINGLEGRCEEWREENTPTADWLVVTVDIHS